MSSDPRPAPKRHSASAQAFASFMSFAGMPSRFSMISVIWMSSQPGKFGGDWMMPRALSSGLPQETPTASGFSSDSAVMRSAAERRRSTVSSGPAVGKVTETRIFAFSSPRTTAHFVPPISNPITRMPCPPKSRSQPFRFPRRSGS